MNSIQCRILVFLVLLTSCFSPVCGKDKKPRQAIEKLSIDGPYLLKADDGSMRAISVDGKGRLLDKHYKSIPTTFSFEVVSGNHTLRLSSEMERCATREDVCSFRSTCELVLFRLPVKGGKSDRCGL